MTDQPVWDNAEERRFEVVVDGHLAELVYDVADDRLVLVHTEVPEELSGRGLGGRLVSAAVERAAAERLAVVPECAFARQWLENHPDVASRVTIDWPRPG